MAREKEKKTRIKIGTNDKLWMWSNCDFKLAYILATIKCSSISIQVSTKWEIK